MHSDLFVMPGIRYERKPMTHDEVFLFMKALWPQFSTKQVLVWYPCGRNTIRVVLSKDKREMCFTVGPGPRAWHLRPYGEWLKETVDEDELDELDEIMREIIDGA